MPRLDNCHADLIRALELHYGSPPGPQTKPGGEQTVFERLARVLLGLVATPKGAAAAFAALREAGMLDPVSLAAAHPLELDDLMKQDGVALALKSLRPVQKLAVWASEQPGALDQESLADQTTESIRAAWQTINGIGLAKADALLLHGLGRASYPVDRATYRVLVRHGWLDPSADYDEARDTIERLAVLTIEDGGDRTEGTIAAMLIRLSEWFERLGREFCKPTRALCERCPLQSVLPPNGPVEVE